MIPIHDNSQIYGAGELAKSKAALGMPLDVYTNPAYLTGIHDVSACAKVKVIINSGDPELSYQLSYVTNEGVVQEGIPSWGPLTLVPATMEIDTVGVQLLRITSDVSTDLSLHFLAGGGGSSSAGLLEFTGNVTLPADLEVVPPDSILENTANVSGGRLSIGTSSIPQNAKSIEFLLKPQHSLSDAVSAEVEVKKINSNASNNNTLNFTIYKKTHIFKPGNMSSEFRFKVNLDSSSYTFIVDELRFVTSGVLLNSTEIDSFSDFTNMSILVQY